MAATLLEQIQTIHPLIVIMLPVSVQLEQAEKPGAGWLSCNLLHPAKELEGISCRM